ncbi:Zn-dependent protease (includes SpoIVFB) [Jatrophihabitans endophyticus]|uniref:Zn-dependent protease (Includes SpoIVFB) n=1 Tax=Jatrophihabitans endophyticus TaxID=1206085 RepID=A0A1M5LIP0_9ACTN|nr:site-2 protease family protein [Jatrophihabitans endophyticus]SHG64911.1 Zn-dependent protease (includes SpoIVFB) [Jatrophihabitans endophyticus]
MSVYNLGNRRSTGNRRPSPLFLVFVAVTALGGLLAWTQSGAGSIPGNMGVFVFVLGGWVVSVCFHEFAHAYAAYRAGDRSVEAAGYLTLNPFKYAHPVLSIVLPLFFIVQGGIGLPGGAVYLHRHAFRSRAMQSVAAAVGPLTNLVLGVVLLVLAKQHATDVGLYFTGQDNHARFWGGVAFLGFLQVTAAVLNLLPVPGLDGYAIVEPYLDPQTQQYGDRVKPWGMLAVIVLLIVFTPLNDAFFDLVDALCRLTGIQDGFAGVGRYFFQFWEKPA